MDEARSESGAPDEPVLEKISPAYARYVLGVLFFVYVLNFIDRQILSVFVEPIKAEMGATDTEMGLLLGFAFALFYTIAGIPIARWADRGNRRSIIALGLTVWSAMTVLSGFTRSFAQLALVRVGVGVGEAAGSPPAHSLISDYFPPERRATAMGIYAWGIYIGSAIAYLGGGYLREYFDWRTAFIVLGTPGLLFALVVRFTVKEPPRGISEVASGNAERATLGETFRYLASNRSWVWLIAASCFLSLTGYGILMWGYAFFGRVHGMPPVEIGIWMAGIVGIGGSLGTYLGGRLADRLGRAKPSRYMTIPALATLASVPLAAGFLLAEKSETAMISFFFFYILANMYVPSLHTINQNLARLRMRATAAAIVLLIINLVGAGAGPFVVGFLNDYFAPTYGAEAIRYSLLSLACTMVPGALCFYLGGRSLAADLARRDAS
jgi:MFS family permease